MSKRTGILAVLLLIVAMFAMAPSASALQDLKATEENRYWLWSFTYGNYRAGAWHPYSYGHLLDYSHGTALNTYGKSKTKIYVGSIPAIRIGNGQCVDFAKAVSGTVNTASGSWRRGLNVMSVSSNIPRGTLIATFSSPTVYNGHVAVFDSYAYDSSGKRNAILVWDQNYLPNLGGLVAKHPIKTLSTGVNNANNYFVVQV